MCVSMSDKPFDAEACDIVGQASATNGLADMKTHIENAPCNRPLICAGNILAKLGPPNVVCVQQHLVNLASPVLSKKKPSVVVKRKSSVSSTAKVKRSALKEVKAIPVVVMSKKRKIEKEEEEASVYKEDEGEKTVRKL
jgi:hypothetical protein